MLCFDIIYLVLHVYFTNNGSPRKDLLFEGIIPNLNTSDSRLHHTISLINVNLNTSDSGLHHTIFLMYVGARHLGFGIT